jgi:hypothetical protein
MKTDFILKEFCFKKLILLEIRMEIFQLKKMNFNFENERKKIIKKMKDFLQYTKRYNCQTTIMIVIIGRTVKESFIYFFLKEAKK